MSFKKIEQIRQTKYFRLWDVLVYGIIILIIAAIFLAVFLTKDNTPANGFKIRYADKTVFTYDFESGRYEYSLTDGYIAIDGEDGNTLNITFYTPDKSGYNKITVDKQSRKVKVVDADCSLIRKDCVNAIAMDNVITCLPHQMYIEPLLKRVFNPDELPIG